MSEKFAFLHPINLSFIGWDDFSFEIIWFIKKTEIAITSQRVIIKTGVFSTRFVDVKLSRVEGIGIQQSAIERMSDSGTIAINTLENNVFTLSHIKQPDLFRKAFQQALEQYIAMREAQ